MHRPLAGNSLDQDPHTNPSAETQESLFDRLQQLEYDNRMLRETLSARDELIVNALHDLRNPLGAILAMMELLAADQPQLNEEHRSFIGAIHAESLDMLRITNGLHEIHGFESRRLNPQSTTVDVQEFVLQLARNYARIGQNKEMEVTTEFSPDLGYASFDPRRIRQALEILLDNAFTFSDPGSTILIRAERLADGLEFSISDNGPGMPREELERIFRPFVRGQNRPTGGEQRYGLGLAVCKAIVEAHGGSIAVKSAPGVGSVFSMFLPA
jgi:signal transduction histidine kinase